MLIAGMVRRICLALPAGQTYKLRAQISGYTRRDLPRDATSAHNRCGTSTRLGRVGMGTWF